MLNRRSAIHRIGALLGTAVSAPTMSALLQGCVAPTSSRAYEPRVLSIEEYALIGRLSDIIIPRTDTPGATDAGVDSFIDTLLFEYYSPANRAAFVDALRSFSESGFNSMSADEQLDYLSEIDQRAYAEAPAPSPANLTPLAFHRRLKELVVSGYYTSEVGQTEELHVMQYGPFRGDVSLEEVGKTWA